MFCDHIKCADGDHRTLLINAILIYLQQNTIVFSKLHIMEN